jgi:hypothetical protein
MSARYIAGFSLPFVFFATPVRAYATMSTLSTARNLSEAPGKLGCLHGRRYDPPRRVVPKALASSDALVNLHAMAGMFGNIQAIGAVNAHGDCSPEAFFDLRVGDSLALGHHIRAGL